MPEDKANVTKPAMPPSGEAEAAANKAAETAYGQAEEEPKGDDKPKFLVYQAGDPVPAPSGHPQHLWSENEWDARNPDFNYYRFKGDKAVTE